MIKTKKTGKYKKKKFTKKNMKGGSMLPELLNNPSRDLNEVAVIVGHGQSLGNQFDMKDNINIITSVDYGFVANGNNAFLNYLKDFLVKIDFRIEKMFKFNSNNDYEKGTVLDYNNYTSEMILFSKRLNALQKRGIIRHIKKNYKYKYKFDSRGLFKFKLKIGPCKINEEQIRLDRNDNKIKRINGAILQKNINTIEQLKGSYMYGKLVGHWDRINFNYQTLFDGEVHKFSELFNKLTKGTYLMINCRTLKKELQLELNEKEEVLNVARMLSTPVEYHDFYVDTTQHNFNLLCYQSDCQHLQKIECNYCGSYLCENHYKIFNNYLLNGEIDIFENNHFTDCNLSCYDPSCGNKGIIIDNSSDIVKLYCFNHYNILFDNYGKQIRTLDIDLYHGYDNLSEVIDRWRNKRILEDYFFNYGEICQYIIELLDYINKLYRCLHIKYNGNNIVYQDLLINFSIFIFSKTLDYMEDIEREITGTELYDKLEDYKNIFFDKIWQERLDFRMFETDILSKLEN